MNKTLERFEDKYMPEPNSGCWIWLDHISKTTGYGNFRGLEKRMSAHRASWRLYRGSIPLGKQVNHTCGTRCCVNPTHFYVGTQKENMLDMMGAGNNANSNKTHCKYGHPYNEKNTHINTDNQRVCRPCRALVSRRWRAREH